MAVEQRRRDLARMERSMDISRYSPILEGLINKHSFEPSHLRPGTKHPNLRIEHMGGRAETFDKLHLVLLPTIKGQLSSLLNSLDSIDPRKCPEARVDSTAGIVSNLDVILESTVSSIVSLTFDSPLPDENHDHGLEKLKAFRCSRLQTNVKRLVRDAIYRSLFQDLCSFIGCCSMAHFMNEDHWVWEEMCDLKGRMEKRIAWSDDLIDRTIDWCRKSDWAMVHEGWLEASDSVDEILGSMLTCRSDFVTVTSDAHRIDDNATLDERNAHLESITEVSKSAIPLAKLARILVRKTLEAISRKQRSALGGTELNSESMKQLYEAPTVMLRTLQYLSNLSYQFGYPPGLFPDELDRNTVIRKFVEDLPVDMESAIIALDACLIPFLPPIEEEEPPGGHLKSFLPTFKHSWDVASGHLMDAVLTFEVERIAI
ncbi:hypothetical protein PTTG_03193 [Puccinia triticina 1-1 BBBD Race 1]|uniref:Uncharacterized protein n=1 Tax=Puccinia triticina (isolate 1-1 / race 1 (BBBD)) TaxID=630390 RepID=A0A0C4EQY2_PUCT1|nr:hypothetical protein PTTG_03193 [Puccinia triticina 1-1 BBBD Race 1]